MNQSNLYVLPPSSGKCPICAVKHDENLPHDATSFFYRTLFCAQWNRSPTWSDAMMHCSPEVQAAYRDYLNRMGIDVDSPDVRGGIKTQEDLDSRLNAANERE